MDVCSRIKLDPSADSFGEILEEGRYCASKQIDLTLSDSLINQWSFELYDKASDFITYVNQLIVKYKQRK